MHINLPPDTLTYLLIAAVAIFIYHNMVVLPMLKKLSQNGNCKRIRKDNKQIRENFEIEEEYQKPNRQPRRLQKSVQQRQPTRCAVERIERPRSRQNTMNIKKNSIKTKRDIYNSVNLDNQLASCKEALNCRRSKLDDNVVQYNDLVKEFRDEPDLKINNSFRENDYNEPTYEDQDYEYDDDIDISDEFY